MAQEHLKTLLTSAGIEPEEIETILALPEKDTTFAPEPYVGKIRTNIETAVKNDPKFWEGLDENNINPVLHKKIEASQFARASSIVKQKALKAFGLKEDDIGDLTDDEKTKLDAYIAKIAEKYVTTKSGAPELQKQLLEARKKVEDLEAEIPTREGKLKTDLEAEYNNKSLDFIILAELATIENLKAPPSYLVKEVAASLKEEYTWVVNGLKATPKQKANPTLDVLEGTKVLTSKDLIIKKLKADGLIDEPGVKKESGKSKVDVEPDGTGGLKISPHIMEEIKKTAKPANA